MAGAVLLYDGGSVNEAPVEPSDVITSLIKRGITPIIIGGVAMRIYNSPRVTQDLDLAVRSLDIDAILLVMYDLGFRLVVDVDEEAAYLSPTASDADHWVSREKPGSLTFVHTPDALVESAGTSQQPVAVPHIELDIESQVDFLYELSVPYARLRDRARPVELAGTRVPVATPADLIVLKQARPDRSADDDYDIAYLRSLDENELP